MGHDLASELKSFYRIGLEYESALPPCFTSTSDRYLAYKILSKIKDLPVSSHRDL